MKPALASAEAVLASLESGPAGLSAVVAGRRLAEFGPNRIEAPDKTSLWLTLAREFTHFFAPILWLAALLAVFAEHAQPGEGRRLYCKGAPETLLPLCSRIATRQGERPLTDADRSCLAARQAAMADRGLRVLALAVGAGEGEDELLLAGLVGLEDPPRPDVREAVARCREAGIKVV